MKYPIAALLFLLNTTQTALGFTAFAPIKANHNNSFSTRRKFALGAEVANESAESTSDGPQKEQISAGIEAGSHDELMYVLGVNLARQLGDISPLTENSEEMTSVARGILDTVVGRITDEQQRALLALRGKELNELITNRANNIRAKIEEAGSAMLQQMKETEGAFEHESGVVIHVLEHGPEGPGEGMKPSAGAVVKVHYHGTLPDGTIFDSSIGKDPVQFPLANVIDGWKVGLQQMHEGEVAMLGIPPNLAYGAEGTPDGRIPGGATLFFKVELLEIVSGGIGGSPLLGADGKSLKKNKPGSSGLLGADGKPL